MFRRFVPNPSIPSADSISAPVAGSGTAAAVSLITISSWLSSSPAPKSSNNIKAVLGSRRMNAMFGNPNPGLDVLKTEAVVLFRPKAKSRAPAKLNVLYTP